MAYLFAMIVPIFLADIFKNKLKGQISNFLVIKAVIFTAAIIALIFILLGIETTGDTYHFYKGYGHFRMNLNAIFDPSVFIDNVNNDKYFFSKIIPDLKDTSFLKGSGDYEGFNFIGLPMIILLIFTAINYTKSKIMLSKKDYLPIIIISLLFIVFSLTNKIILNDTLLLSYPLPGFIKDFFGVFRSSGRFFWPVYYILTFFSFYLLYQSISKEKLLIILSIVLVIGFIDSSQIYTKTREVKSFKLKYKGPVWQQILKDSRWIELGDSYKKIKLVYPELMPDKNTKGITLFAVTEGLSINGGYLARIKKSSLLKVKEKLKANLKNCELNIDSLYIFNDKDLWEETSLCPNKNKKLILDGIYVIAPNN